MILPTAFRNIIAILLFGIATSCSTSPTQRAQSICPDCRANEVVTPGQFRLSYFSNAASKSPGPILHIYLEGDGIPWVRGVIPAKNPNSKSLLALQLLSHDPFPAVYLNRPCYGLSEMTTRCTNDLWTHSRYSQTVVNQLNYALDHIKNEFNTTNFVLVGYSGGGSLAVLLAHSRDDIVGIMTIAANLDHRAWTEHFGYLPLSESLNAADALPLSQYVQQLHLVGKQDTQVPNFVTLESLKVDANAKVKSENEFNHHCCWVQSWEQQIRMFRHGLESMP